MLQTTDEKRQRSDLLKLLAIVLMVVDHVGAVFFPEQVWLRMIGRLAFPIFAYCLSQGALHSSNPKKYMIRLWSFALISQVPYTLLWDSTNLNILFVLFASLLLIYCGKSYAGLFAVFAWFIPMDYGVYGLLAAPLMYWCKDRKWLALLLLSVITALYSWHQGTWIQMYAIAGFALAMYMPKHWLGSVRIHKSFFYWFYPTHLAILLLIKYFIY